MLLIAITGGIGSGKSVVSHLLKLLGYHVYDTDSHAKKLMNESVELKRKITNAFGVECYIDGIINRQKLASIIFNDSLKLNQLNSLVHPTVCSDIQKWASNYAVSFVETAIPYTSGISEMADRIWVVNAPEDLRISRVVCRSSLTESEIKSRIKAQALEFKSSIKNFTILNDGVEALLPQIINGLKQLKEDCAKQDLKS